MWYKVIVIIIFFFEKILLLIKTNKKHVILCKMFPILGIKFLFSLILADFVRNKILTEFFTNFKI